jgi:TrwC relaxase/AAA domain/Pyridine nucleotide-disulphide oxidoreductase
MIDSNLITDVDVLVVGAGQAGLAAGLAVRQTGLRFLIMDAGDQPGGSWPHFYESLTLFSPARFSTLPGLRFPGRLGGYPTRDDMARYLSDFATHFELPVRTRARVLDTSWDGEAFELTLADGDLLTARAVIAASGGFGRPVIPELPGATSYTGRLVHSANYALAFIEQHALFTRTGPEGIRQVNVRGLVAAAFTHRDSRAGDPDLHTHVAVANKVQTLDGRWLSIDGRMLFKANVAASETYNTALEQHLRETLGVRFAERPGTDPAKRPIREIVGVDPRLNQRWSTRRAHINTRRGELAIQFQEDHGRPPTAIEALHLAQQATLETRDAKHEPRSLAEQRATWLNEAAAVLGGRGAVASMVQTALTPPAEAATIADARWVAQTAGHVLAVMEECRSTWQMWHVRAEVQRQLRPTDVPIDRAGVLVDLLIDEVLDRRSVALVPQRDGIDEPQALRRTNGSSVYTVAGADLYTSQRILDAEQRLIATAGRRDGSVVDESAVDLALLELAANRTALDAGQASLVRQMCTSGARLQLAIAPAGAGKTTAMRALTLAWTQDGGQVLGLAPSAAAAAVLGEQTGIRADTLAKLTWSLDHGDLPEWATCPSGRPRPARRRC